MPILLVRHGNTEYDHKIDALLNPPLNHEGVERIRRTVAFLDDSGYKPSRIISSPLQRALKVAEMISRGNKRVTVSNACLPWNLGDLMGKVGKEFEPQVKMLENFPDMKAPHGESYRKFYLRWESFLWKLMAHNEVYPEDTILITTHSRNINALQEVIDGNPVGDVTERASEGSVTLLAQTGSGDWSYKQIWDGK